MMATCLDLACSAFIMAEELNTVSLQQYMHSSPHKIFFGHPEIANQHLTTQHLFMLFML